MQRFLCPCVMRQRALIILIVGALTSSVTGQCTDACQYPQDGICDDGGLGSQYNACPLGSDCTDCGVRIIPPPSPPIPAGLYVECRFIINANSGGGGYMQFSELQLQDQQGGGIPIAAATSACDSPAAEGPAEAVDGNTGTKWLCRSPTATLYLTLAAPSSISAYELFTANDHNLRDPTDWQLECRIGSSYT
eukprot:7382627-Prymnesium_polylepis.1